VPKKFSALIDLCFSCQTVEVGSKSRLNFLDLLRAGYTDFVLIDTAFGYMRSRRLFAPLIARLAEATNAHFVDLRAGRRI
jgi:hypothetical protein